MDNMKENGFEGDSELVKAVKLLEENGFYVVHADSGWHSRQGECPPFYPNALLIQAYPKRLASVAFRPDPLAPV